MQGAEGNGDAGDQYAGLDRFGRIGDQRWHVVGTGGATHTDPWTYAYDRNSSPLYRGVCTQPRTENRHDQRFDRGAERRTGYHPCVSVPAVDSGQFPAVVQSPELHRPPVPD